MQIVKPYCIILLVVWSISNHVSALSDCRSFNRHHKFVLFLKAHQSLDYTIATNTDNATPTCTLTLVNTPIKSHAQSLVAAALDRASDNGFITSYTITTTTITLSFDDNIYHLVIQKYGKGIVLNIQRPYKKRFYNSRRRFKTPVIALDPGHGGIQPGTVQPDCLYEKTINLAITKKTAAILKKMGYSVMLTRSEDQTMPLYKRVELARDATLFVAIHANAAHPLNPLSPSGIETYSAQAPEQTPTGLKANYLFINTPYSDQFVQTHEQYTRQHLSTSASLANCIQQETVRAAQSPTYTPYDRGTKTDYFQVLILNSIPAALVEVGYLSNPTERALLQQNAYQQSIAQGIATGIVRYLEQKNNHN